MATTLTPIEPPVLVGETGEFDVYSASGSVYRVCLITETCDCPSTKYQDSACKHQRRVEMELAEREVPELNEETDVEMMIHAREEYCGLGDSTVDHRPAADAVVVTDGGVATETATQDDETLIIGPHLELPEQGGATYYKCENCGGRVAPTGGRRALGVPRRWVRAEEVLNYQCE